MASEPRQGPLEVALSRSPFTQNGSWSMVDIAKLAVQIPVGMLSRYAAGRVNAHTILVAEAMGMTFRMGKNGRSSLEKAFSKLSSVSTLNGSLYIGFGIEDFTREMIKSEAGAMLVGLCAALKECYTDDVAIEVMLEYARQTKADGQWMPSNMEWRNLLDACAGCLATSNFALRAEHLMQLAKGEQRTFTFRGEDGISKKRRGCSTPKSIADALSALAMLSNGRMEYVSLTGGPDGGWLAAVAEWFLDLKVKIVDNSGLEVLYTNHADDQDTQVTVLYSSQAQQARGEKRTGQVAISDKTYKVSLEDLCKTFLPSDPEYNTSVVSGRLSWTSALRGAFGSDFERLMTRPNALGTAIGSAAVLCSAIAEAHQNISPMYLRSNVGYSDSSHGQGLVVHAVQQFPELGSLKKSMEEALRAPFRDAQKQYETSIASLATSCHCFLCTLGPDFFREDNGQRGHDYGTIEHPSDELEPDHENAMEETSKQYCFVVIAEMIIRLCILLSNVVTHAPDLQPMRGGFELSYGQCVNARRSRPRQVSTRELGLFSFCIDLDSNIPVRENSGEAITRKTHGLLELYTGRECLFEVESASALNLNGISAFLSVLTPSHGETNDQTGQVHLVPGRISFEGKSYMRLVDRKMQATNPLTVRDGSLTRPDYALTAQARFTHRLLSVREGPVDLHCLMEFTHDVGADGKSSVLSVGPFAFAAMLAMCRGLVHCKSLRTGSRCASTANTSVKSYGMEGEWLEYKCEGRVIMIMRPRPGLQALAMLAFLTASQRKCWTYIVDSQCDSCCIRAAMAGKHDPERRKFCFVYVS